VDYLIFELDGNIRLFLVMATFDALLFLSLFLVIGTTLSHLGPRNQPHRTFLFRIILCTTFSIYYLLFRHALKANLASLWILFPTLFGTSVLMPLVWQTTRRRATAAFLWLAFRAFLTRACSVAAASALLVIFAVPAFTIALFLRLRSAGPVFVAQPRLRYDGKTITLIKFRTKTLDESRYVWSPFRGTAMADLRVTRSGRWLRASGLYRLPMLWSVLRGDLELFGLTPLMLEHLQDADMSRIVKRNFRAVSQFYGLHTEYDCVRAVAMRLPVGMISYSSLHALHLKLGKRLLIRQLNLKPYMLEESDFMMQHLFPIASLWLRFVSRFLGLLLVLTRLVNYKELVNNRLIAEEEGALAVQ
jgi:hypothetical protein